MKRQGVLAAALAALLIGSSGPAWAAGDGFAAFWTAFSAAAGKNDRATIESLTKLEVPLGSDPDGPKTFTQYYALYLTPKARRCLAKTKPMRDATGGDVRYEAFCGPAIFSFAKVGGAWRFVDIGADD